MLHKSYHDHTKDRASSHLSKAEEDEVAQEKSQEKLMSHYD